MNAPKTAGGTTAGERIAKVIARAGLCSRRDAERWIADGRVAVNGRVLASPAVNVGPADRIAVDGVLLPARERTRLWLYHKPKGLVTTARDPEGRPTVFAALPPDIPRVVAVGRLDIATEGLLLLTNDGGLARLLELPSTGWLRRYRVRAHGDMPKDAVDRLAKGVTVEGVVYGPVEAALDRSQGSNHWLTLGLREGKNREVKRLLAHLGLTTTRLIRISYGPFQLGELTPGAVVEIRGRVLRDQLGAKLAAAANADFTAPLRPPPKPAPTEPARDKPARRNKPGMPERAHRRR
jgi:23S rRNA pseudouridine2605 synthase